MATIREVAKLANVSAATVSRILSGDTTFSASEETRNTVFAAVHELGYVPYMKRQKKRIKENTAALTVGCIFSSMYGNEQVDPTINQLLNLIDKNMAEYNMALAFAVSELEIQSPAFFNKFKHSPPDALIFIVQMDNLVYQRIRSVVSHAIGINCFYPDINCVTFDKERTMENAVEYLLNTGHTQLAYIGGPGRYKGNLLTSRRFRGFKNSLEAHGLYDSSYVKNCRWLIDECYLQTKELLALSPKPDAIICGSDNIAFSVYRAIYEEGLQIPGDVSVMSSGELPISEFVTPTLTTYRTPHIHIVHTAMELLKKSIQQNDAPPIEILYHAELVIRESTSN